MNELVEAPQVRHRPTKRRKPLLVLLPSTISIRSTVRRDRQDTQNTSSTVGPSTDFIQVSRFAIDHPLRIALEYVFSEGYDARKAANRNLSQIFLNSDIGDHAQYR
jgi:hypothetical protein